MIINFFILQSIGLLYSCCSVFTKNQWTDKTPNKNSEIDLFAFEDRTIAPLKILNLGYFKNDVLSWPITVVNYYSRNGKAILK